MRFTLSLLFACCLSACGGGPIDFATGDSDDGGIDGGDDGVIGIDADQPKPVLRGVIGALSAFVPEALSAAGSSPVAAALNDGTRLYGFIDSQTLRPMLRGEAGSPIPIPGTGEAKTITIAASDDGALHIVWGTGTSLYYNHRDASGLISEAQLLADGAKEPTLGVSPMGGVVVAYTADPSAQGEPQRIMVTKGYYAQQEIVFGETRHANPDCCVDDFGGVAYTMSGPSLAIAKDGSYHIVYEWMSSSFTRIEYIYSVDGAFVQEPIEVTEVGFMPCPAISVDDNGTHITYLTTFQSDAWYVNFRDGVLSTPVSLFRSGGAIEMSMMLQDGSGAMHVAIHQRLWNVDHYEDNLLYLRDGQPPLLIDTTLDRFKLTPRAGGALVTQAGALLFSYENQPTGGVIEPRIAVSQ